MIYKKQQWTEQASPDLGEELRKWQEEAQMTGYECHGHIVLDGNDYQKAMALHRTGLDRDVIRRRLAACADQGIRFYRDGGDCVGASEYAAGIAAEFDMDYRTPIFAIHKKEHYGGMFGKGFGRFAEYEQLVHEVKERGGNFIKIMISGIMDFNRYGTLSGGTLERSLIQDMVAAAHEAGYGVMAHVNTAEQIAWALEAGADSIEHGYYMDDRCLELLAQKDAVWVPTFAPVENARKSSLFSDTVLSRILELHRDNLRKAVERSLPVACGSDAGSFMVPPAKGSSIEEAYLEQAAGPEQAEKLKNVIQKGNKKIRERF